MRSLNFFKDIKKIKPNPTSLISNSSFVRDNSLKYNLDIPSTRILSESNSPKRIKNKKASNLTKLTTIEEYAVNTSHLVNRI